MSHRQEGTMGQGNGKSDLETDERQLDASHELPAAEADTPGVAAEQYERLKQERDSLLDRAARLQAEFDNARRRSLREQQEFKEYALADALKSLLPILDSLDRAVQTSAGAEDLKAGVQLIDKQFHDALAKLGVEPVPARGEVFDPNLHQAVQMVETDEAEDNHVIDELQRGYKLKERLLRPAMVRVARNPKK
jgi:molecular chaperone GrpE